jgi:hypothetical protein
MSVASVTPIIFYMSPPKLLEICDKKKMKKKIEVKAGSLKEVISSEFQTDTTGKIFFHTEYLEAYTPVIFRCKCRGYKR